MTTSEQVVLYRYEEVRYASSLNEFDECLGPGRLEVVLYECPVLKYTPHGTQVSYCGSLRFVLSCAKKKFACLTKHEAIISFLARKTRQSEILVRQIETCESAINLGEIIARKLVNHDDK